MYKDNAVGNVVAETGRDLVVMTTARLSDLSARFDAHLKSLHGSRQRGAANLYDVLIREERWIVKRRRSYAFSHRGTHFCLRGVGEEGGGEI